MDERSGFTLLEVMIAILILGLSMASLFSAQAGAIAVSNHIKYTTIAGELARCKMSELELKFFKEGFEEAEFEDWEEGECCELREEILGMEEDSFQCRWKIETIKLPSIEEIQTEATKAYMSKNVTDNDQRGEASGLALSSGLLSGLLPIVQDLLEQAIRKVTVEVRWSVGGHERSFQIVQYITNPAQGNLRNLLQRNIMEEEKERKGSPLFGTPNFDIIIK